MKVLVVANYNPGYFSPFVIEQMAALQNEGVEVETYGVVGKGFFGYLSNISGIYPTGEGAGYAGGITTAAMDGLKQAENFVKEYKPFE